MRGGTRVDSPLTTTGFFSSLFGCSFSSLITTRIITVVYIIVTVAVSWGLASS